MKRLVSDAITIARVEIGVREISLGNTGPRVDQYIRRAGLRPPCSWCACFVYWCIDEAAIMNDAPNPFHRTGFCPYLDQWARQEGILHATPQAGDVFLLYGARAHHTGLVVSSQGNEVATVEGNTNDNGSSNGDGVYSRIRRVGPHIQFIRWESLIEEDAPKPWGLYVHGKPVAALLAKNNRNYAPLHQWAKALGLAVAWDDSRHAFKIGGKLLDSQVVVSSGTTFAPVRDLADLAGLKLDVDRLARRITAHR